MEENNQKINNYIGICTVVRLEQTERAMSGQAYGQCLVIALWGGGDQY
jgi:hypothetical protein